MAPSGRTTANGTSGTWPPPVVSGRLISWEPWSDVTAASLVETRIWQFRNTGSPNGLAGAGSFGERHQNEPFTLPLVGLNRWLVSLARKVPPPLASATTAAGDVVDSQFCDGSKLGSLNGVPSHSSMKTELPCWNPVNCTSAKIGLPDPSPGQLNAVFELTLLP